MVLFYRELLKKRKEKITNIDFKKVAFRCDEVEIISNLAFGCGMLGSILMWFWLIYVCWFAE